MEHCFGAEFVTTVTSPATERILRLSSRPGVGVAALRKIVEKLRSPGAQHLSDDDLVSAALRPSSSGPGKKDGEAWRRIIDKCESSGISIMSPLDALYPTLLGEIEDYPPLLYVKGNSAALMKNSAAVVGTREASKLGLSWARQIATIFAEHEFSVVSGLALGIDTAAHEGALKVNGSTVAILAHGLDQVTPASNRNLAEAILQNGGALVAEHPPGVPPRKAEYVRRNRIQSGVSLCSVVVESGESGGAIHQGNFTRQQGRVLFCVMPQCGVPGSSDFRYEGGRRLMRERGALPLSGSADLLHHLLSGTLRRNGTEPYAPPKQQSFL